MQGCSIPGCDNEHGARGWCNMHYERWKRTGDPTRIVQPQGLPVSERFWSKVGRDSQGCWEWTAYRNCQGYGQFVVDRGGSRYRNEVASRVAWELAFGPIPPGVLVCHRCDNPPCVRPEHLFLGTPAHNKLDSFRKGRSVPPGNPPQGERNNNAKLSVAAVRDIRRRYAAGGVSQQSLADEYGVNQTKISAVVRRDTWRHVD